MHIRARSKAKWLMHFHWLPSLTGRRCGLCIFVSTCWTLFRKFPISEFAYEWTAKWRACASLEKFEREKFRNTRPNSNGFSRSFKGHFGAVRSNTTRRPYSNLTDYDGVRICLRTAATNGPTVHPPGDMWAWRAMVMMWWWWFRLGITLNSSTRALWNSYQQRHLEKGGGKDEAVKILPISIWNTVRDI
jgi:hypothetical protein